MVPTTDQKNLGVTNQFNRSYPLQTSFFDLDACCGQPILFRKGPKRRAWGLMTRNRSEIPKLEGHSGKCGQRTLHIATSHGKQNT